MKKSWSKTYRQIDWGLVAGLAASFTVQYVAWSASAGQEATETAAFSATFSDANWSGVEAGSGPNDAVYAAIVDRFVNLYIGGRFTAVADVQASRNAKWDGRVWSALGSGVSQPVYTLAVSEETLYVGGIFNQAGGVTARNRVAKWALDGTGDEAWSGMGSGMNNVASALALTEDALYVGGNFSQAGGVTGRQRIARWALGSTGDSGWSGLGSGVNGAVNALAVVDGALYVGGNFSEAGNQEFVRVAKWGPANFSQWTEWIDLPPESRAAGGDPFGIGVANLACYAFGIDPARADRARLPQLKPTPEGWALAWTRSRGALVDVHIHTAEDLVNWEPWEETGEKEIVNIEKEIWRTPITLGLDRLFIHLSMEEGP